MRGEHITYKAARAMSRPARLHVEHNIEIVGLATGLVFRLVLFLTPRSASRSLPSHIDTAPFGI